MFFYIAFVWEIHIMWMWKPFDAERGSHDGGRGCGLEPVKGIPISRILIWVDGMFDPEEMSLFFFRVHS